MIRMTALLPFLMLLGLAACQFDSSLDIRDYYFPLRALEDGLVYEYRLAGPDSLSPDYWYYRAITTDSAFYFTKAYYQQDFLPQQLAREEMVSNGIMLADLFLFETDSLGHQAQVKAAVLSPSVFPFSVQDSTIVYLYKVQFSFPSQPHVSTTFILNRRFRGETTFNWQGETYPAVRFSTRGVVEIRDNVQGGMEPEFSGEEIYAKGLGLVAYARHFGSSQLRYVLYDRYPMPELVEQAKGAWE